jgi:hypothetical protein
MSLRLALVLVLAASLVPLSQRRIDQQAGVFRAQEEVLYLWSGEKVKRLVPGFESIAADVYWLRTVQYFGGQRLFAHNKRFELLRPLIDITTTLDPRFEVAYRYGAIFLSEQPPLGAGRPQEGIEVLERGAQSEALRGSWRLRQDLGFFQFLFMHDADKAAKVLVEASEIPGAAFWLRTLAADLLAKGGDRESSRRMWRKMFEQGEEGVIRDNARVQLMILDALDARDRLAAAVIEFERRRGRRPARLEELVAEGLWRGPLVDTAGVRFGYDADKGRVFISENSPMWRPE